MSKCLNPQRNNAQKRKRKNVTLPLTSMKKLWKKKSSVNKHKSQAKRIFHPKVKPEKVKIQCNSSPFPEWTSKRSFDPFHTSPMNCTKPYWPPLKGTSIHQVCLNSPSRMMHIRFSKESSHTTFIKRVGRLSMNSSSTTSPSWEECLGWPVRKPRHTFIKSINYVDVRHCRLPPSQRLRKPLNFLTSLSQCAPTVVGTKKSTERATWSIPKRFQKFPHQPYETTTGYGISATTTRRARCQ